MFQSFINIRVLKWVISEIKLKKATSISFKFCETYLKKIHNISLGINYIFDMFYILIANTIFTLMSCIERVMINDLKMNSFNRFPILQMVFKDIIISRHP